MSIPERNSQFMPTPTLIEFHAWRDPLVDEHPMRLATKDHMAVRFMLPTLGPTPTWAATIVAGHLAEATPLVPFWLVPALDFAAELGNNQAKLHQALERLARFGAARRRQSRPSIDGGTILHWAVRTHLVLDERSYRRLPPHVRRHYDRMARAAIDAEMGL